jgi:hypothetical protein
MPEENTTTVEAAGEPSDEAQPEEPDGAELRLKELQDELQKQEKDLADSTAARDAELGQKKSLRDALKSAVDAQTLLVDEIKKSSLAFGKGLDGLQKDVTDITDYRTKKAEMIDAVLGKKKEQVVAKINEVENKVKAQQDTVNKKSGEAETARKAAEVAQQQMGAKQDDFNRYKQLASELAGNIQKMKGSRSKIEENDDPPRAASMYVYINELKKVLDVTKVPSQDDFDKKLNDYWKALDDAKKDYRDKKLAWEAAKSALAGEQTTLVALQKSEIDDKLKATNEFN